MKRTLSFFAPGIPAPGGSKKAFVRNGRAIITDDSKRNKQWRSVVALAAHEAMKGEPLFDGALQLWVTFMMPRLKGHFGKKGVKPGAPLYVTTRPDASKLLRSTEDALTQVVWHDDAQVAVQQVWRFYGDVSGAHIKIETLEDGGHQPLPDLFKL